MHLVRPPSGLSRVAVLAHGSGSTADFCLRAFGQALTAAGIRTVALDDRSGDVTQVADRLGRAVDAFAAAGVSELWVGGISLGAHAAAIVAAGRPWLHGVLLALPAWTGPPGAVAELSLAAARDLERDGLRSTLARLGRGTWVAAELATAWPTYGADRLAPALRATGRSAGPSTHELAAIEAPTGLFAVPDDPFHPADVARQWADLVPRAALVIEPVDPAEGAPALGRNTLVAWRRAAARAAGGRPPAAP